MLHILQVSWVLELISLSLHLKQIIPMSKKSKKLLLIGKCKITVEQIYVLSLFLISATL